MRALRFSQDTLYYLDQRMLPHKEIWRVCKSLREGFTAIKQLRVRGAPLIGVFSAYCIYVAAKNSKSRNNKEFVKKVNAAIDYLRMARPTAVNLFWALDQMQQSLFQYSSQDRQKIQSALLQQAKRIHAQDIKLCEQIGYYGARVISRGDNILTHCNAGLLATSGNGTALSVIYRAFRKYKEIHVYVDETRPLLQGARLTAWELVRSGIRSTLICDNMAASLMRAGKIQKVIVGADRIAANGDVANKIGTYGVAVNAYHHNIPFYVAAPFSTFDLSLATGEKIPIEQRPAEEVAKVCQKVLIAPKKISIYNPAFDVTPHKFISGIITDRGIIYPPYKKNIGVLLKSFQ